jgi:hypothetical protein
MIAKRLTSEKDINRFHGAGRRLYAPLPTALSKFCSCTRWQCELDQQECLSVCGKSRRYSDDQALLDAVLMLSADAVSETVHVGNTAKVLIKRLDASCLMTLRGV